MPPDPSEEMERMRARTAPLPVDVHTPHANLATRRNDKVKKQAGISTAESSFCVEAITFTKVSGLPPWMRNRLVEQKDSVLLILTSTASEGLLIAASLAFCIVPSKLILLYSGHLEGGQTVKNYLVHTCISIRTLTANIMIS